MSSLPEDSKTESCPGGGHGSSEAVLRHYEPPKLSCFGDVQVITQQGGMHSIFPDNSKGNSKFKTRV